MAETYFDRYLKDIETHFSGWDFSYLEKTGRMHEGAIDWNYYNIVKRYFETSDAALDMGTGGGEFLSMLKPFPEVMCATESYEPNILLAKQRLEPLGVKIYSVKADKHLPIEDHRFDLIINRHEAFDEKEVSRILKPGGCFITQQVGGFNDRELHLLFGEKSLYVDWKLNKATNQLRQVGFEIMMARETLTKTRFYDLGALVYYLKAVPWVLPNFSIAKYKHTLKNINDFIETQGFFDVSCHRFIVIGMKTNA